MAEKAQQEPQLPWSFTPVTAPFLPQSTESGRLSVGACAPEHFLVIEGLDNLLRYFALNSVEERSANWFMAI